MFRPSPRAMIIVAIVAKILFAPQESSRASTA
jgi:hypothetical protein